jgi:hypothetical protein
MFGGLPSPLLSGVGWNVWAISPLKEDTMFDRKSSKSKGNSNSDWKAAAFINLFLPRKDGSRMKLGFCALKSDDPEHLQLMEWLEADEGNLNKLATKLVLDYRAVEEKTDNGLDL